MRATSIWFFRDMSITLRTFRALADPTRLRIVALLERDELSVAELQEVTKLAQSRISTHLGQLSETGMVVARKDGKRSFYRLNPMAGPTAGEFTTMAIRGARELPDYEDDQLNLKRIIAVRMDQATANFNRVAGRFDRSYGPGRSWQAFGHLLLRMLPPLVVADLGSGEGLLAELLARRCSRVIAIDNSEKMVAFGARRAEENDVKNLEFRLGDIESPPIESGTIDVAILSQALHHAENPEKAIQAAAGMLKPGGFIVILDLSRHNFEQARHLYGDLWLGFSETDLHKWLERSGFNRVEVSLVAKEEHEPYFETLMASGYR